MSLRVGAKNHTLARPFVKWAGGKRTILNDLLERVPQSYGRYFEPFAGGAALFFALSPEASTLCDKNPHLVNAYLMVRDHVEDLIDALRSHPVSREHYYKLRELDPWKLNAVERAAWFIYLNKTCYNGLWRVNSKGRFNVPYGRYSRPAIVDENNLRLASFALKQAIILSDDFAVAVNRASAGDFVYFDPPYHPLSTTANFTNYTGEGFDREDQERLAWCFGRLSDSGVFVMESNSDTPLVRQLYKEYRIERISAPRPINSRGDKRGKVSEVLIRNY